MAGLSAPGLGSGLDISSLVTQLVAAERAPQQTTIDSQRSKVTSQVSALGSLKSSLSALRDAIATLESGTAFGARTATSSDSTAFSASAAAGAVDGSYAIEVVQLAAAQKSASASYASSSAEVGTGTLSLGVGSTSIDIVIDSSNNTLAGIRDAINSASDNPGVSATIINGTSGSQLVLTSRQSGVDNSFSLAASGGDGGLDTLVGGFSSLIVAKNAIVKVDTIEVSSATNTVSGAIDGVTLNLAGAKPGVVLALDVGLDRSAIKGSLDSFVKAYNGYISLTKQLTAYDATSGKKGALLGDSTLRSITSQISRTLGGTAYGSSGSLASLSELGISVQLDGTLALNADKLTAALDTGIERVSSLFAGSNGLATALSTQLGGWIDSGGTFESRTQSLDQRTRQLDDGQARLDARMLSVQARYQSQFTKLDSLLSSLNNTSTFLTQQLAALNNTSS